MQLLDVQRRGPGPRGERVEQHFPLPGGCGLPGRRYDHGPAALGPTPRRRDTDPAAASVLGNGPCPAGPGTGLRIPITGPCPAGHGTGPSARSTSRTSDPACTDPIAGICDTGCTSGIARIGRTSATYGTSRTRDACGTGRPGSTAHSGRTRGTS
ncbi:hypothetical protein [Streptomyces toxytricini]|uniref:hypothetical protein n=1 Tax=Streptomyces toxytricini TaxID=67369 RepID=UPI0034283646